MANSYTLTDIANLCHNEIRMIGTLTEFAADSYIKNDVAVVRYKGVVKCNDAFINIKATTTSFDDTFKPFVDEFSVDVIERKVFIIGKLNSVLGVNVDYIAMAYNDDYFEGNVVGICNYEDHTVVVVNNEAHNILPLNVCCPQDTDRLRNIKLIVNPLITNNNVIVSAGYPSIIWKECTPLNQPIDNLDDILNQAIEEHKIYLEAIQQIKEGR